MAPQIETLSTFLQAMTQDDCLSLCLRYLSQCPPKKIAKHSANHSKLQFKCSICGKAFSSYHALGGHKSSHRRLVDPSQMIPVNINVNTDLIDSEGLPHRCNVCYKSFATGQSLGGHKRCHYFDLSSVRDFDLNLPPKKEYGVWGEEEEVSSPLPVKKQPRLI